MSADNVRRQVGHETSCNSHEQRHELHRKNCKTKYHLIYVMTRRSIDLFCNEVKLVIGFRSAEPPKMFMKTLKYLK